MLRDEKNKDLRWHIALEITNGDFQDKTSGEIADSILSLPTELVKVEQCKNCNGTGAFFGAINPESPTAEIPCHTCHGSGELIRPLTLGEAVELLKDLVDKVNHAQKGYVPLTSITLPDGSRVRIRKPKEGRGMRKKRLLTEFKCEQEGKAYIASANLNIDDMPQQHVFAISTTHHGAISSMLKEAYETINEYFSK